MSPTVKYFLKLVKDQMCSLDGALVIKNFMTDQEGHRAWCIEDAQLNMKYRNANYKKTTILGIGDLYTDYIKVHDECSDCIHRSTSFEFNWNDWGTTYVQLDNIDDHLEIEKCIESVFMQMLLAADKGHDILLGNQILIKKNSTYEHIVNIDMTIS